MKDMCGIVGYVGNKDCKDIILRGLSRLEYRGYDSSGIAIIDDNAHLYCRKKTGKLRFLEQSLTDDPLPLAHTGIGHTRWATHGAPCDQNAHPHLADNDRLAVVHNGIIENFHELKNELTEAGITFYSQTDTEVAAKLLGQAYQKHQNLEIAFREVVQRIHGAFTLLAVHANEPNKIVAARLNSPLVIGIGQDETFLSSDVAAFAEHTRTAIALGQEQIAVVTPDKVTITNFQGEPATADEFELTWDPALAEKGGWKWFMGKEIAESPMAVENTLRAHLQDGQITIPGLSQLNTQYFQQIDRVIFIGCGTAHYSTLTGAYAFEKWTGIPTHCELSHEFRYREPHLDERTLVISLSQSGETMDVLMAVRYTQSLGAKTLSICNTQGATIARESDCVLYTHAGPEVAVASTKAFIAQVVAIYLLALYIAQVRNTLPATEITRLTTDINQLPKQIEHTLNLDEHIKKLAHWMSDTRSVLYLGRHVAYPVALEGALKLKEIAYIHAEGFAAGELKHGPIALIEPGQPVFVLVPSPCNNEMLHPKVISNIQEIRARGARVLAVCETGDAAVLPFADEVLSVPVTNQWLLPILQVVPLQLFALELADAKGIDVDQPRNLAKSVTVE